MKNKIIRGTLLVIAGILAFEFGSALKALSGRGPKGENSLLPEYSVDAPSLVENAPIVPLVKKVHMGSAPTFAPAVQVAMLPTRKDHKAPPSSKIAEVFPKNEQLFHSPPGHTNVGPLADAQGPYPFTGSGTPAFSPGGIAPSSQGGGGGSAPKGSDHVKNDLPKNDQPKDSEPKQEFPPEDTLALTDPQNPPLSSIVLPDQTLPENTSELPGVPNGGSNPSGQTSGEGIVDATPRAVPDGGLTALLLGVGFGSLVLMRSRSKRLG